MRKKIIFILFLVLLGAAGFFWWRLSDIEEPPKVLASEEVTRGPVREELDATGIVQSQVGAIVKIGAQATGRINRMLVKVGDGVEKGDLIAEIDSSELLAQKAEAEAQLEAARAESEYASSNLTRQEKLAQDDLIARDTLDKARQEKQVKEKQQKARRAALETILTRISYTRIISPITGIVSQVAAQEGETVVAGLQVANLITVLDPSRLEMWIYVDETDIGRVTPGLPVEFQVDAYPTETFHGAIKTIYPEPEVRDNIVYYQALVTLDPAQAARLRPEMTTQCKIIVREKQNVLSLPNAALKWVEGEQVVFVVEDHDIVRRVSPRLGLTGLTHSEVLEGLSEGDRVATQLVLPGTGKKGEK